MADDEVRTSPEPKRSGQATPNRGKQREPAVIDGTAEEIGVTGPSPDRPSDDATPWPSGEAAPETLSDRATDPSVQEPSMAAGAADLAAELHGTERADPRAQSEPIAPVETAATYEPGVSTGSLEPPTHRSRFPALLSLLGLILIGLLSAILYSLYNPPKNDAVAGLSSETDSLKQRIAVLEARPVQPSGSAAPNLAPLEARLGAVETTVIQLKSDLADARSKLDDLGKAPNGGEAVLASQAASSERPGEATSSPAAPAVDIAPLQAEVANLDQSVAALQGSVAGQPKVDLAPIENKIGELGQGLNTAQSAISGVQAAVASLPKVDLAPVQARIDGLDHRLGPIETAFASPKVTTQVTEARQEGSAAETRAAPLAIAAQAVLDAIREGKPFKTELTALQSLGADDGKLSALRPVADKGAPARAELLAGFADVKDGMLAKATPAPSGGVLDRMVSGARNLVRVRPAGTVQGNDPDAVASRIEADLQANAFAAAQTEWTTLPDDAKASSQGWADRLKARVEAEAAARAVASDAIAALGTSK